MTLDGKVVSGSERSQCFADFFEQKVRNIVESTNVDPGVYNGERVITAGDEMFMSRHDIIKCMLNIKEKNCEGYDRIPQRVLLDGFQFLLDPLVALFSLIYTERAIPDQWRFA